MAHFRPWVLESQGWEGRARQAAHPRAHDRRGPGRRREPRGRRGRRRRSGVRRHGAEGRERRPLTGPLRAGTAPRPGSGCRRNRGRTSSRRACESMSRPCRPWTRRCWSSTFWTERWPQRARRPASPRATRSPTGSTWSAPSRTCRRSSSRSKDAQAVEVSGGALAGFPPGCWVDPEPALEPTPAWAIDRMQVPAAWVFSEQAGRPSRGEDVIVAQPDTGITAHVELVGVAFVPGFDVIDDDNDPTDPLTGAGNPGHGTGTASVLVSLDSHVVTGSAPQARLMPIRAIESVVRIRQITVARAIDWAIQEGAHVVTMSLGGIPASALHRAISRAVEADLIVLAAAGNCVRLVVWPARYDECIAVAATNAADQPWPGTCRGAPVDISAPGQNVYRAVVPPRWPHRRRHRRPRAGHELLGRPHRGSRGTVGGSPRTSQRGRRCTCPRRDGPGDVPPAAAGHGPPTHPVGRQAMGPGIVDARALLEASFDVGLGRVAADTAHRRADRRPPRASPPWWPRPSATRPSDDALDWHRFGPELAAAVLRRQLLGPHTETPPVSEPLAHSISNPRLREWLGLRRLGV